jgi:hypothetical protein
LRLVDKLADVVGGEATGLIAPSDDMRVTDPDFSEDPTIVLQGSSASGEIVDTLSAIRTGQDPPLAEPNATTQGHLKTAASIGDAVPTLDTYCVTVQGLLTSVGLDLCVAVDRYEG